jgi:hypothetical protein
MSKIATANASRVLAKKCSTKDGHGTKVKYLQRNCWNPYYSSSHDISAVENTCAVATIFNLLGSRFLA